MKIGHVYKKKKKDSTRVLEYYERSVQIRNKIKGKDYIDAAETLNNFGLIYYSKEDSTKALESYEQSLQIGTKSKGKYSIDVA